jgi:hypothetical protein
MFIPVVIPKAIFEKFKDHCFDLDGLELFQIRTLADMSGSPESSFSPDAVRHYMRCDGKKFMRVSRSQSERCGDFFLDKGEFETALTPFVDLHVNGIFPKSEEGTKLLSRYRDLINWPYQDDEISPEVKAACPPGLMEKRKNCRPPAEERMKDVKSIYVGPAQVYAANPEKPAHISPQDFLRKGADTLDERAKEYDKPDGERSMGRCITAFNAITGHILKESEGWLLLQILKDVRQWSNPDRFHEDSAVDCINYGALKSEALSEGK